MLRNVLRDFFHDIINGKSLRYYKMLYSITPLSLPLQEYLTNQKAKILRQRAVGFVSEIIHAIEKVRERNERGMGHFSPINRFSFASHLCYRDAR